MTSRRATGRLADALALVAVGAAALVALVYTHAHYDALDRDRALLIAETTRFGPGTRGRVESWLTATRPGHRATWHAHDPGLFDDTVRVDLRILPPADPSTGASADPAGPYPLRIGLADRHVEPLTPAAAALIEEIATWADAK